MKVYIEDFFIQNLIINFCLLRLVFLTTKPKSSFLKILISSIIGAGFSVFSAIFIESELFMNTTKLICAIFMIFIAFKSSFKLQVFNLILLFIYTFSFGGIILSLSNNFSQTNFGLLILPKVNLYVITLTLIILTYIFELVSKHLKEKVLTNKFIYEITLYFNKQKLKINAYLDSGNLMKIKDKPAIILDLKTYLKLSKKTLVDYIFSNKKTINTATITTNQNLTYVELEKVEIKRKNNCLVFKNQPAIINTNSAFKNENYKALLSPLMLT